MEYNDFVFFPGNEETEMITPKNAVTKTVPMPLMNTPFLPGTAKETALSVEDPDLRAIALAEYAYFSGNPEDAVRYAEPYLLSSDKKVQVSACLICAYANLAMGNIGQSRSVLELIQKSALSRADMSPETRATAVFTGHAASILLHLPAPSGVPPLETVLRLLPPGVQSFALYLQAHHAYLQEDYGKCVGIVETTLSLQSQCYPIPNIYLHLVAAMAYMSMKQVDSAKAHLSAAYQIAQPDDLIEAFGEHHGLLGGLLEAVIKKESPDDFRRIISITYRFSAGWRKIHNPDTGHDVADNLTTTEFAACMLAARGWTNQEIGDHMGISTNTVKQHISVALNKLHIRQRKDLKQFMLK